MTAGWLRLRGGHKHTDPSWARRRIACAVVNLAFAVSALLMVSMPVNASAATLFVSAGTGSDAGNDCLDQYSRCATIQHAIDEASAWDQIDVAAGTYTEDLTIDKRLTLKGPNWQHGITDRNPEAIIDGGSGVAVTPQAEHIEIGGFTLASDGTGFPVRTSGADVNQLTIADNIIDGGPAAIRLDAGGEGISVERNLIEGDGDGIFLGNAPLPDLAIENNHIDAPPDFHGIFAGNETTTPELELSGNEIKAPSYIGGTTKNGRVGWNVFDIDSPGAVALQIRMREWILISNTFMGNHTAACLQILGSQGGLDPSRKLTVSDSDFQNCTPFGIQLSPGVKEIYVTGDTFAGSYDGVSIDKGTLWSVTGSDIHVFGNRIVGSTHLGIDNSAPGVLDAHDNWWGCNAGPGGVGCDGISTRVDASPNVLLSGEVVENGEDLEAPLSAIDPGGHAVIVARLDRDSAGGEAFNVPTDGTTASISASNGFVSPQSAIWGNDRALAEFTAGAQPGSAGIVVRLDNQQVEVPLRITGSLPPVAPPSPAPLVNRPRIEARRGTMSASGQTLTIGRVVCGDSLCRIHQRSAVIEVGDAVRRIKVKLPAKITADGLAPIEVKLPRGIFRQLSKHNASKISATVKLSDISGFALTKTITAWIKAAI